MTTHERIQIGLVGYGKVAQLHARALRNLPQANLMGVCGRNLDQARRFAQQHQITEYATVTEMVARGAQAVIICTPHPAHAADTIAAAQAGAHILVEKPLATTLADCDRMIEAARRNQVKLGVVSQRRFYEPIQRMKQAIDAGKIGTPMLGNVVMYGWRDQAYYEADAWRGTWELEGGGVLVNQAPHQFDLLQWLMASPIDSLFGFWGNLNHPYIEVDDTATALVRFKNGALGNILVSNSQKPGIHATLHIHGSNGASVGAMVESGAMFVAGMSEVEAPPLNDIWTIPGEEHLLAQWHTQDHQTFQTIDATLHYLQLQDEDFLQAILEDREPLVTGESGRVTVELFTAIYRSQAQQALIKFPLNA